MADGFDALDRKTDLRRRALADAAAGLPPADAIEPGATERDILARFAAAIARFETERATRAAKLADALRRLAPPPADLDGPAAAAQLEIARIEARRQTALSAAQGQARAAQQALATFREHHGLNRPAIYPAAAVLSVALVLLAALFEASFSASLFADIDPMGLAGGAAKAVGLSLANVALGFLAGFLGLRYLGHRTTALRVAGAGALLALTLGGLGLTFFAAQWRDRAELPAAAARKNEALTAAAADNRACMSDARKIGDLDAPRESCRAAPTFQDCLSRQDETACARADSYRACRTRQAKASEARAAYDSCARSLSEAQAALNKPAPQVPGLPVTTPQGLILLMLGAAVFLFAALKGYSGVDDPYPDYGKLDRAAERADAHAGRIADQTRAELEAAITKAETSLNGRAAPLVAALDAQRKAYDAGINEIAALDQRARDAAESASAALGLYRRENSAARRDAAPAYFADPTLPDVRLSDVLTPAGAIVSAGETALVAARARIGAELEALSAALRAADQRLTPG